MIKNSKRNSVSILVEQSRKGDEIAKAMLIEKYMYIVDDFLLKQKIYITDDIKQEGYLLLSKCINHYLNSYLDDNIPLVCVIYHYVKTRLPNIIQQLAEEEDDFYKAKERMNEEIITPIENQNFLFAQFELIDIINSEIEDTKDREILLRLLNGQRQSEIAEYFNVSRSRINQRTLRSRELIKKRK